MNQVTNTPIRKLLALLLLGLVLPLAVAQGVLEGAEQTGVIAGVLDGAELQWRTLAIDTEEGTQNTANYDVFMERFYSFTLQGHQGTSLIEGTLSISFTSLGGPLTDCPCDITGEIMYWTTTSMFNDVYMAEDAVITVLEFEELSDGAVRLTGTATAQLYFHESATSDGPSGDPVALTLDFTIDRVGLE